jgi:serine/threonine-protein kinase
MIGKTIGKYRFVEELKRGGLGTVYRAIDETLEREVAIKVLNPELNDSELMKHFQAEATTLARLHHPDIASIHEFQRADSDLLIVTELVHGEALEQLANRCGPLPPERAAYLVAQVLGALEHAHSAGVVHRDLQPSSVMVTEQGGIKVMDFGMARGAAADQSTSDGFTLGPPSYMAPERLAGQELDGRADVYSAGVIFYRLLTGHVPFEAATPLAMVQKQLAAAPTPVHTHRADLPGWCQAIIDRAIARAPADRFPTAEAFRVTLLAAISEATESTGVYSVVQGSGPANSDGVTRAAPVPVPIPPPMSPAEPLTVATPAPRGSITPPEIASTDGTTPAPALAPTVTAAASGTTVVLKRNQFAVVGGLLLALVLGVVILAIVALRRPTPVAVPAPSVAETAASPQPSTPATGSAALPASDVAPAAAASAPGTSPSTSAPAVEINAPPLMLPPPASPSRTGKPSALPPSTIPTTTTPDATPARPGVVTTPFRFDARAVVADGDKRREREASILVADGSVTVSEKDKSAKPLYVVPIDSLIGLTYSSSKQPLWDSPNGPAEAMRVEGGAFGFLKGGKNNWFGLRTKDSLLVLRVDDDAIGRVTAGLQERSGLTLQRLVEPKD